MTDFMSVQRRSLAMSRVRGKETRTELLVRSLLHRKGFRYRNNVSNLPGRPDIVLPKYKAVIFVNGCFWHGHFGCNRSLLPESNEEFWHRKISRTVVRDGENIFELQSLGWRVAVVWQCCLRNNQSVMNTVDKLVEWIIGDESSLEIPIF